MVVGPSDGFSRKPGCADLNLWLQGPMGGQIQEEDKRATTNVQHRFVQFLLLPFLLFCSH